MEDMNPTSASGSVDITTQPIQEATTQDTTPTNQDFDFREYISDEFKESKSLEQYKDLNGLVKSHLELNKMMGSSIRIPKEDATPEEIDKFYSKLGRPETKESYEYIPANELPAEIKNDEMIEKFREKAFELGLSNKQFNELANFNDSINIENFNSSNVSQEQQDADFIAKGKEMFGDKYDAMMQNASKLITDNLPEDQRGSLDKLNNEQLLIVSSLLNNLNSKYMKPDTITGNYKPANTREDGNKELAALVEKQNTLTQFSPDYDSTQAKIKELYNKGYKIFNS